MKSRLLHVSLSWKCQGAFEFEFEICLYSPQHSSDWYLCRCHSNVPVSLAPPGATKLLRASLLKALTPKISWIQASLWETCSEITRFLANMEFAAGLQNNHGCVRKACFLQSTLSLLLKRWPVLVHTMLSLQSKDSKSHLSPHLFSLSVPALKCVTLMFSHS